MSAERPDARRFGLAGAVGVGVGAIVGGGILALAGAAFAATGPSALVAFALNGLIALLTALSFAEVSSKFPQSGGTYTFAKKVLSVEAAFVVGWVVWFASVVAAALYALGFGEFASIALVDLSGIALTQPPPWLGDGRIASGLAIAATLGYTLMLMFRTAAGGQWANVGKVSVFFLLIVCGFWALRDRSAADIQRSLLPFFAGGGTGLLQAMGFTFIALQGFDLIAAVAGEIRQPERTIPRAMLISLGIALLIYLPLLLVISTVGTPVGESIHELSRQHGEAIVAIAAENYLGRFGYWLVMVAGLLSMLSALQANLFAASRVALSMARDRTLPRQLGWVDQRTQSPLAAVLVTGALIVSVLGAVPNVAAAGAAASLIFLITFALAHWIAILVRQRSGQQLPPFRVPCFPAVPILGGTACVALAVYQGAAVPAAGMITVVWLSIGGLLFLSLFARRARLADASTAALDPELIQLRGRSPLVLVPLANPDTAPGLVAVANALAPAAVGRVLLLSVVVARRDGELRKETQPFEQAHHVLCQSMAASFDAGLFPEALATVAAQPWEEITRVARAYRCESLLLGLSQIGDEVVDTPLDQVMSRIDCDVVVLRAPKGWQLSQVERILVPTAGRGGHDLLLARLLGSLSRETARGVTLLRVLRPPAGRSEQLSAERELSQMAHDLRIADATTQAPISEQTVETVATQARDNDLIILGVQRVNRRRKLFGQFALDVARRTSTPMLLISSRG